MIISIKTIHLIIIYVISPVGYLLQVHTTGSVSYVMYFISYWKSVLHRNKKKSHYICYCENRITFFPMSAAVAIIFYVEYFLTFSLFNVRDLIYKNKTVR
jgi:hypothetical protein